MGTYTAELWGWMSTDVNVSILLVTAASETSWPR